MNGAEVLIALRTAFWIAGAFYIFSAVSAPAWFGEFISFESWFAGRPRVTLISSPSRWRYLVIPLLLLGVGVFTYYAAYPIIDLIPFHWGYHDDEGDWIPARETTQVALAIVGGFTLIGGLEKQGNEAWLDRWHEKHGSK
ncbi:hypothetical protein UFOVP5_38 [uncultured Caudovirales phage]|uniref:Uncharacterized protein n=1 Tax=uncultured Caudovirales phage TaxID=2100421 RepID=A0A6J5KH50_9CAUD|nr:hypothetical protein UFOVP5_38 [uncultured Caudovirales phage]